MVDCWCTGDVSTAIRGLKLNGQYQNGPNNGRNSNAVGWGLQFPGWFLRKPKVLAGALRPMTASLRQSLVETRTECGDGGIA